MFLHLVLAGIQLVYIKWGVDNFRSIFYINFNIIFTQFSGFFSNQLGLSTL